MGLDLGNLRLGIKVDVKDFDAKMRAVDKSARNLKKGLEDAGKTRVEAQVKGKEKLDEAAHSADKFRDAMRQAREEGGKLIKPPISSEETEKATSALNRLGAATKSAFAFAATTAGIAGVGAAFQATVSAGNDFTNNMNTLAAVSGATATQLEEAGKRARELGNDVSLPATSAGDAALAMSELAKGGFSVEQAMSAAKGTLQLAAAAQVDGATAATIQSQALQAFRLGAEDAARVSDILAGGANASSAEIQGIAHGLQQAGTVANGFGVSVEDTVTALAMFANAGIQGSDAGTLLKSSLLAITDQSKPAQGAVEELGLTLYDMENKFVGLPSLFEQLSVAQKNMTDEQFHAATATLFGSDAIRQAMVAAEQGGEGFEKLKAAVVREGQAAEVAAARTRGLPGAISSVSNAAEELSLRLYDLGKGPAEQGLRQLADGITYVGDNFDKVPVEAYGAALAMLVGRATGATKSLGAAGGSLKKFTVEMRVAQAASEKQGQALSTLAAGSQQLAKVSPVWERARASYQSGAAGLGAVAARHSAAADAAKQHALETKSAFNAIDRIGAQASHSFAANVSRMGSAAAGAATGGLSLLKSAGSGLMGALGGPWGLAIAGAGVALGALAEHHVKAAAKEAEHKANVDALTGSLNAQTGAITEVTRELLVNRAEQEGLLKNAQTAGVQLDTVTAAMQGQEDAYKAINAVAGRNMDQMLAQSALWKTQKASFESAGISAQVLQKALIGDQDALSKFVAQDQQALLFELQGKLDAVSEASFKLADGVSGARGELQEAEHAAARKREALAALEHSMQNGVAVADLFGKSLESIDSEKTITVKAGAITEETRAKLNEIGAKLGEPFEGKVKINFPDGVSIISYLDQIGIKTKNLDGYIHIENQSPEIIAFLETLGLHVKNLPNGDVVINSNDPEVRNRMIELGILVRDPKTGSVEISDNVKDVLTRIDSLDGHNTSSTHTVTTVEQRVEYWTSIGRARSGAEKIQGPVPIQKENGGIVQFFSNGGEYHEAEIARPGTIRVWNEPETEGEAYIPMAVAKRRRSEQILGEVARRFGKTLIDRDALAFAHGGILGGVTNAVSGLWGAHVSNGLTLGQVVLRADDDTKRAFDELDRATDARANAAERVTEAEKALAEARTDEKADPKKIEKAEKALEKARKAEVEATDKATEAAQRYAEAQRLALFKVAQDVFRGLGEVFNSFAGVVDKMAERAQKQVEQQKRAVAIAGEAADAQLRLQEAMLAAAEASRQVAKQRWQDDLAVSDAEWDLSLARKRGQIEVAQAARFAGDVQIAQARTTRETATLEAAVALAKAQRDLAAFERAEQLKLSSLELEHAQKLTEIQTQKLALSSLALAQAQNGLYGSNSSALDAMSQRLSGIGGILGGVGGIAGGIAGIAGAIGMAATNPLGALVAGLGALPGLLGGIGGIIGGVGQIRDSREMGKNGSAAALEALEHKEQLAELEVKKARVEAGKASLAQRDLLSKLVDNAEKALALAQQKEKREKDLEDLFNASENDGASVFFQLGGSGWGGDVAALRELPKTIGGFGGVAGSRAEHDTSWRVEGQGVESGASRNLRNYLKSTPSPQVTGAAAAISTAQHAKAIRVSIGTLVELTERLVKAAESDRSSTSSTMGTVLAPINITTSTGQDTRLAAALAVQP